MEEYAEKVTPRYACGEILKLAASEARLTKRPWDRFRPDSTGWYLIPSTSVIYYKYGKLFFSKETEFSDTVNCGLYFEKGLGGSLGEVYSSRQARSLLMDDSWFWNKFLASPVFPTSSFSLLIEGGYVTEPNSFDPYKMRMLKWDKYIFACSSETGQFSVSKSDRSSFILKLHNVKNKIDFISALKELEKDPWLWLNVFIYRELNSSVQELKKNCNIIYGDFLKGFIPLITELGSGR